MLRGVRVGESLMLRGRAMVVGGQLTLHFPPRSIRQQPIAKNSSSQLDEFLFLLNPSN